MPRYLTKYLGNICKIKYIMHYLKIHKVLHRIPRHCIRYQFPITYVIVKLEHSTVGIKINLRNTKLSKIKNLHNLIKRFNYKFFKYKFYN